MWDLPRPGLEPVSPALAGRFSTTAPPGKPPTNSFSYKPLGVGGLSFINSRILMQGFPGGAVVKNPPANAGDSGSSPGPGGATKTVCHNY